MLGWRQIRNWIDSRPLSDRDRRELGRIAELVDCDPPILSPRLARRMAPDIKAILELPGIHDLLLSRCLRWTIAARLDRDQIAFLRQDRIRNLIKEGCFPAMSSCWVLLSSDQIEFLNKKCVLELIESRHFTMRHLSTLKPNKLNCLENEEISKLIKEGRLPMDRFLALDDNSIASLRSGFNRVMMSDNVLTLDQVLGLTENQRVNLDNHAIYMLFRRGGCVTLDELKERLNGSDSQVYYLCQEIIAGKLSFKDAVDLKPEAVRCRLLEAFIYEEAMRHLGNKVYSSATPELLKENLAFVTRIKDEGMQERFAGDILPQVRERMRKEFGAAGSQAVSDYFVQYVERNAERIFTVFQEKFFKAKREPRSEDRDRRDALLWRGGVIPDAQHVFDQCFGLIIVPQKD